MLAMARFIASGLIVLIILAVLRLTMKSFLERFYKQLTKTCCQSLEQFWP